MLCVFYTSFAMSAVTTTGCDTSVNSQAENLTKALLDQKAEAAKAIITKPVPISQQTCLDQYTELSSSLGGVFSNPGGNNSASIGPVVQQPLKNTWQSFTSGQLAGSITSVMNNSFAQISSAFNTGLSSLTGGLLGGSGLSSVFGGGSPLNVPSTNCDAQEQAWLISQCIEMPTLPSLANIVGGKLGELAGAVDNLGNLIKSPERMLEAVCKKANSTVQGYIGDINSSFNDVAQDAVTPIGDITNSINATTSSLP